MTLLPRTTFLTSLLLALALGSAAAATTDKARHKKAEQHTKAERHAKAAKAKKPAAKVDYAGEEVNFGEWKAVREFADQMVNKHGFQRSELDKVIAQVHFVESAVQLVKPAPPGKPKNWAAYKKLFIDPVRVEGGIRFWNENAAALARAEAQFGVPAEIIVAIIGVETVYGRNTGRFRVLDTLTTLAFAYPEAPNRSARMDFFRGELENALLLARKQGVDPFSLIGSFAGAVGLPQFMPGNILKLGIDYDGDGVVDLRGSTADAIGSVANFLVEHGWRRNEPAPFVYPVQVSPKRAWEVFINLGLAATVRQEDLLAAGVAGEALLPPDMLFGLVDLQNGADATEYWLATNNFFAITQYNRSYFYAMSVIELGRAIRLGKQTRPIVQPETL